MILNKTLSDKSLDKSIAHAEKLLQQAIEVFEKSKLKCHWMKDKQASDSSVVQHYQKNLDYLKSQRALPKADRCKYADGSL